MTALDYALLAQKSYADAPTFGNVNSAGRAVMYGDVLAFRGSDDISSWVHDIDACPTEVTGLGRVHAGFWSAYMEIKDSVLGAAPSVTTGHSLGAAMAILAAADLCLFGRPPKACYAFEPPRASIDSTLGNVLAQHGVQIYLYKNGNDLVPDVPIHIPFYDWQHCRPLIHIGKPAEPYPNVTDHEIQRVIDAL